MNAAHWAALRNTSNYSVPGASGQAFKLRADMPLNGFDIILCVRFWFDRRPMVEGKDNMKKRIPRKPFY